MPKFTLYGAFALLITLGQSGPAAAQPDGWQTVIERVSATEFILEPGSLDKLLADPAWVSRQGRFIPQYVSGEPQGFKILGVRKGSFWALMGVKNGDVVRAVNGLPLTTIDATLKAYTQVKGSSFVLDISRDGAPLQLSYTLKGQPKAVAPPPMPPMPALGAKTKRTRQAEPAYEGGGRLRAHVALDFGDTPGDVQGTLRVMTDAPVVWGAITGGADAPMPGINFGRGELLIRVSPGETAPSVEIVTLTVDEGDIAIVADPKSTITFRLGQGLNGARLDLRMTVTAGPSATGLVRDMLAASKNMTMTCRGSVLSPRCRLVAPSP